MKFKLIKSNSNNPSYNLALEEYLIEKNEPVVYLWINSPTIVIGRNQNPYKECNVKKIHDDGIFLERRRSGGGAVYHDLGNINFTIISKKTPNAVEENFNLVINVLKKLGINAKLSGRNDLEVDAKKISGSAFYENENMYLHHGTLLVNVDLNRLSNYLTASPLKLISKGIESVKSRVINLCDINPNINNDMIINGFIEELGMEPLIITEEDIKNNPDIIKKANIYNSFEWTYGECMGYDASLEKRFSWGIIEIDLKIDGGIIKNSKIYTDSIIIEDFKGLEEAIIGKRFKKSDIIDCVNSFIKTDEIKENIISLFEIN